MELGSLAHWISLETKKNMILNFHNCTCVCADQISRRYLYHIVGRAALTQDISPTFLLGGYLPMTTTPLKLHHRVSKHVVTTALAGFGAKFVKTTP